MAKKWGVWTVCWVEPRLPTNVADFVGNKGEARRIIKGDYRFIHFSGHKIKCKEFTKKESARDFMFRLQWGCVGSDEGCDGV